MVEERPTTDVIKKGYEGMDTLATGMGKPVVPAHLYISAVDLNSLGESDNGLLRFYSDVKTINHKTRSGYTLFDCGASHGFIDAKFAKSLGLIQRKCGRMRVTTANVVSDVLERRQVYLNANLKGITGNQVKIDGWYTVFDLKGNYDVIVGKNWMSANPHIVDHKNNILHMLKGDWAEIDPTTHRPALVPAISITGLRKHQGRYRETYKHCLTVATAAGIELVTAKEAYEQREQILVAYVRMSEDDSPDTGDHSAWGENNSTTATAGGSGRRKRLEPENTTTQNVNYNYKVLLRAGL